jgi:hypothetical protein
MGTPYKKEAARAQGAQGPVDGDSEGDSNAEDLPGNSVTAANQAAMRILVDNRSVRGSTASRLVGAMRRAEASPSWPGIGAHYPAWVHSVKWDPTNPEAAINEDAPERAYLAVMNGDKHLSVLHHLHWWRAHDGGQSRLGGAIVAFEGEVREAHGVPLL